MRPKQTPQRAPESSPDPAAERRRLFRVLGIGIAVASVIAVALVFSLAPKKLTEADRIAMRRYEQIRIALARDDLSAAQDSAAAMIGEARGRGVFHDSAVVITRSGSLEEARSAFASMSEHAQRLVKGTRGFYIVDCSMTRCPVKCSPCRMHNYSGWVQVNENIENPFMGHSSPHCGVIKASY